MTDKNNIPRVKVFQQLKINVSNVMYVYKKDRDTENNTWRKQINETIKQCSRIR